jgi:hypothetical protein
MDDTIKQACVPQAMVRLWKEVRSHRHDERLAFPSNYQVAELLHVHVSVVEKLVTIMTRIGWLVKSEQRTIRGLRIVWDFEGFEAMLENYDRFITSLPEMPEDQCPTLEDLATQYPVFSRQLYIQRQRECKVVPPIQASQSRAVAYLLHPEYAPHDATPEHKQPPIQPALMHAKMRDKESNQESLITDSSTDSNRSAQKTRNEREADSEESYSQERGYIREDYTNRAENGSSDSTSNNQAENEPTSNQHVLAENGPAKQSPRSTEKHIDTLIEGRVRSEAERSALRQGQLVEKPQVPLPTEAMIRQLLTEKHDRLTRCKKPHHATIVALNYFPTWLAKLRDRSPVSTYTQLLPAWHIFRTAGIDPQEFAETYLAHIFAWVYGHSKKARVNNQPQGIQLFVHTACKNAEYYVNGEAWTPEEVNEAKKAKRKQGTTTTTTVVAATITTEQGDQGTATSSVIVVESSRPEPVPAPTVVESKPEQTAPAQTTPTRTDRPENIRDIMARMAAAPAQQAQQRTDTLIIGRLRTEEERRKPLQAPAIVDSIPPAPINREQRAEPAPEHLSKFQALTGIPAHVVVTGMAERRAAAISSENKVIPFADSVSAAVYHGDMAVQDAEEVEAQTMITTRTPQTDETVDIKQANETVIGEQARMVDQANSCSVDARDIVQRNHVYPTPEKVRKQQFSIVYHELEETLPGFYFYLVPHRWQCDACGSILRFKTKNGPGLQGCAICDAGHGSKWQRLVDTLKAIPTLEYFQCEIDNKKDDRK